MTWGALLVWNKLMKPEVSSYAPMHTPEQTILQTGNNRPSSEHRRDKLKCG